MIIKHTLIVEDFNGHKLGFVKVLKSYTLEGLKGCKYVADLLPNENYFNKGRIEESIKEHIKFLKKHTDFIVKINTDKLVVEFEMDSNLRNEFELDLEGWGICFELHGLEEYRNEKINFLLDG